MPILFCFERNTYAEKVLFNPLLQRSCHLTLIQMSVIFIIKGKHAQLGWLIQVYTLS